MCVGEERSIIFFMHDGVDKFNYEVACNSDRQWWHDGVDIGDDGHLSTVLELQRLVGENVIYATSEGLNCSGSSEKM